MRTIHVRYTVQCMYCGFVSRIERPHEKPCRVEFRCDGCSELLSCQFGDVLESPAEPIPPTDLPTPE